MLEPTGIREDIDLRVLAPDAIPGRHGGIGSASSLKNEKGNRHGANRARGSGAWAMHIACRAGPRANQRTLHAAVPGSYPLSDLSRPLHQSRAARPSADAESHPADQCSGRRIGAIAGGRAIRAALCGTTDGVGAAAVSSTARAGATGATTARSAARSAGGQSGAATDGTSNANAGAIGEAGGGAATGQRDVRPPVP